MSNLNSFFEEDKKYIAGTYNRFPVQITEGKGSICKDSEGNEYIDLGTGIAVNTFGFCDEKWIEAVTEQLNSFQHTSNLYYSSPCIKLAKLLSERTGCSKVFFSNSGAEANECAIKVARKYSADVLGIKEPVILTLVNSFHGRTVTTLAATGQDVFHNDFLPLTKGFAYTPANDVEELRKNVDKYSPCAIMFETVQGEGGVNPLDKEFVDEIVKIAKEKNILLIVDEVQTGNGRTGQLYGYMNFGFTPDIVSTAKGLGGGLPIGATMLFDKVKDVLTPSSHGSTFGGNPVACAGAVNIIERIDDSVLCGVKERNAVITETLSGAKGIKGISGMGLMLGIETEKPAADVVKECMKNGVLVLTAKTKVRLLPALNIPIDILKKALEVIKEACK
ncbi:MAG: acetylornithine/succinylornithine family transaminase [Acutalibacteraceae bacterium]|nr:acetylornithine/succinylornithine family transaminase [Acutalibacteraceae bacterium]